MSAHEAESTRLRRFRKVLEEPVADLVALRKLAWSGAPERYRALTWKLLLVRHASRRCV